MPRHVAEWEALPPDHWQAGDLEGWVMAREPVIADLRAWGWQYGQQPARQGGRWQSRWPRGRQGVGLAVVSAVWALVVLNAATGLPHAESAWQWLAHLAALATWTNLLGMIVNGWRWSRLERRPGAPTNADVLRAELEQGEGLDGRQ